MDEPDLRQAWRSARSAWPGLDVAYEAFWEVARDIEGDVRLEPRRAAELYLACGCAHRDPRALSEFEAHYIAPVPALLKSMHLAASDLDEVQQLVRQRLLLGDAEPPTILRYAGRGSLCGLVQVTATRIAIDLVRRHAREPVEIGDDLLRLPVGGDDPELAAIKAELRTEFRVAFERAMAGLTARQRTLLRLHFIDGVAHHKLATTYGVHRATVVRWIADAKQRLLDGTLEALRTATGRTELELSRIFALVRSRLDLSVHRYLERLDPSDE